MSILDDNLSIGLQEKRDDSGNLSRVDLIDSTLLSTGSKGGSRLDYPSVPLPSSASSYPSITSALPSEPPWTKKTTQEGDTTNYDFDSSLPSSGQGIDGKVNASEENVDPSIIEEYQDTVTGDGSSKEMKTPAQWLGASPVETDPPPVTTTVATPVIEDDLCREESLRVNNVIQHEEQTRGDEIKEAVTTVSQNCVLNGSIPRTLAGECSSRPWMKLQKVIDDINTLSPQHQNSPPKPVEHCNGSKVGRAREGQDNTEHEGGQKDREFAQISKAQQDSINQGGGMDKGEGKRHKTDKNTEENSCSHKKVGLTPYQVPPSSTIDKELCHSSTVKLRQKIPVGQKTNAKSKKAWSASEGIHCCGQGNRKGLPARTGRRPKRDREGAECIVGQTHSLSSTPLNKLKEPSIIAVGGLQSTVLGFSQMVLDNGTTRKVVGATRTGWESSRDFVSSQVTKAAEVLADPNLSKRMGEVTATAVASFTGRAREGYISAYNQCTNTSATLGKVLMASAESFEDFVEEQTRDDDFSQILCVDGATGLHVARASTYTLPHRILGGCSLCWEFRVKDHDLGFTLRLRYQGIGGSREEDVFPMERYPAGETYQGKWKASTESTVVMVWDNSYSRFFSKSLAYKVKVIQPGTIELQKSNLMQHPQEGECGSSSSGTYEAKLQHEQKEPGSVNRGTSPTNDTNCTSTAVPPSSVTHMEGVALEYLKGSSDVEGGNINDEEEEKCTTKITLFDVPVEDSFAQDEEEQMPEYKTQEGPLTAHVNNINDRRRIREGESAHDDEVASHQIDLKGMEEQSLSGDEGEGTGSGLIECRVPHHSLPETIQIEDFLAKPWGRKLPVRPTVGINTQGKVKQSVVG